MTINLFAKSISLSRLLKVNRNRTGLHQYQFVPWNLFRLKSCDCLIIPVQIEKLGLTQLQFKVGIGSFLSKVDSYCDFEMFSRFKTVVRRKVFYMFDFDLAFNETLI